MTPEVLALRIGKTAEGEVTLSMYKSAMLAALRSMLPKIPGAQLILIQILQCMDKPTIFPSFHLHHIAVPFGSSAKIAVVVAIVVAVVAQSEPGTCGQDLGSAS